MTVAKKLQNPAKFLQTIRLRPPSAAAYAPFTITFTLNTLVSHQRLYSKVLRETNVTIMSVLMQQDEHSWRAERSNM